MAANNRLTVKTQLCHLNVEFVACLLDAAPFRKDGCIGKQECRKS